MRTSGNVVSSATAALGFVAAALMVAAFVSLEAVRPKMIQFEALTAADENLVNYVGAGLLMALVFYLLSLYQIVRLTTRDQRISRVHLVVLAAGVLSLLFLFGDVALLSDIGNQYEDSLAQPEWSVLYGVMAFQLATIIALVYVRLFDLPGGGAGGRIVKDNSAYVLAQFVGTLCGLTGLTFMTLNFFFPRPLWMVQAHTLASAIILLVPYGLIVTYWLAVKLREGNGECFDEKQRQDIGRSAFATLLVSQVVLVVLFAPHLDDLSGMLSVLWLPFELFMVLYLVFYEGKMPAHLP